MIDAIACHVEVQAVDLARSGAHREERGLVDEVGEIGAAHAGRAPSHDIQIDVGRHPLVPYVDFQDAATVLELGEGHDHLTVEAARPEQGRIEDVGPVRRRHHHDPGGDLEAVHLGEHLVQRLLAFVVAAAEACTTLAPDRVDLVDEDDGPADLARGLEQVAHPARTDADEHLHEVRARHGEERHPGLTGNRSGDQRLARARRADEQDALRDASTDLAELLGELEEVDDLADLLFHTLVAGYVGEGRPRAFGRVHLRPRPPDGHDAAHLRRGAALHPDEEQHDQADG